jgi:hypothetical protein
MSLGRMRVPGYDELSLVKIRWLCGMYEFPRVEVSFGVRPTCAKSSCTKGADKSLAL